MPLTDLPAHREESAPSFTTDQPDELERYFDDLHFLFLRHNVTDQQDRKEAACMYTSIRTEQLWKTTEAWLDQTQSYEDFKTEVLKLYPGVLGSRSHTLQELEWTVGRYARNGIQSTAELGEYYRQYLLITRYLIAQGSISDIEQSRGFFQGLQPTLEGRVCERLQQRFIDHFPDDPYPLSDIFEAADFILRSSASLLASPRSQPHPLPIPAISDPSPTQSDPIDTIIAALTEKVAQIIQDKLTPASASISAPDSLCRFCGGAGHFVRTCKVAEDFVCSGKCKRHPDGKITLPTGAMAPRGAPDSLLCDRIEDWHQQNPGNTAAQLFCGKAANSPSEATTTQRIPALHQQQPQRHPVAPHRIHPRISIETATSTTECKRKEPAVLAMLSEVLSDQYELDAPAETARSLRLVQIADEYAATACTLSQPEPRPSALTHFSHENKPQPPKQPADEPEVATQSAATEASCKGAPEITPPPIHSLTHTAAEPSERSQPAILPPVAAKATQLFAIAAEATLSVVDTEVTSSFVAAEATLSFVAAKANPSFFVAAEASPTLSTAAQQQSVPSSFPFLPWCIPITLFSSLLTNYCHSPNINFPCCSLQPPQS